MSLIHARAFDRAVAAGLIRAGIHPVLARAFAARGVVASAELEIELSRLLPFQALKGARDMASRLADAIRDGRRILIVADYDADGATACAVGMRALGAMGARVDFLVPNRFEYGYGLTPEIVRLAAERKPDILVTVDNGIASVDGVAEAARLGMEVFVTDHHLPGAELPDAAVIVNPNQPGCPFPSKGVAGVGVMFYVMLALRAELRARGAYAGRDEPNLGALLDLVALGTVADVVPLDANNRRLVHHGLTRICAGRACPGVNALFRIAGRDPARASTRDLAFMAGPRLNAAGRLSDMSVGIACLLSDDEEEALTLAGELDRLNRERREIEAGMQDDATALLDGLDVENRCSLVLFDPAWHAGVVGILASRVKDLHHRPVIAFAPGNDADLKGSGRSIAGLHLRDALDLVSKREPDLVRRFGGHAAAAGVSIARADFERFSDAFEAVARERLTDADLTRVIETDGALTREELSLELAQALADQVWGQGFPAPVFEGDFTVAGQRLVGDKHLKLKLETAGRAFEAILFNQVEALPARVRAVYRPDVNEWNGARSLQLVVSHWENVV